MQAFPEDRNAITELFAVLWRIQAELGTVGIDLNRLMHHPFEFKDTVLYGPWPVARVFEHLGLSPRVRAVLAGQCGDIGLSPRDEPFLCLQALLFGYGESADFPKRGMGFFVDRVVEYLAAHGGTISYKTPVTRLVRDGNRVAWVETPRDLFAADLVISNIDPGRDSTSRTASCTGCRSARRSRICTSPARPPGARDSKAWSARACGSSSSCRASHENQEWCSAASASSASAFVLWTVQSGWFGGE